MAGPAALTSAGFSRARDLVYARLERMPFGKGLALFGGTAAALIFIGGMGTALGHGSGPGAPLPEAVQTESRAPAVGGAPDSRPPAPTHTTAPQGSILKATRTFRVPAAAPPRKRPEVRRTAPAGRTPLWRHDPSQWEDRPWFWHWRGNGGRDRR